jgi:hypothetical protein
MWWPGTGWSEGHNSAAAARPGIKWGLGEGESGGLRSVETYVLIANTSSRAAQARVSVFFENGQRLEQTYGVLPNSRYTVAVGEFFPEARDRRYGVIVESVGDDPAELIVERAMYSDAVDAAGRRTTWAAGSGALGTRIK